MIRFALMLLDGNGARARCSCMVDVRLNITVGA